MDLHKQKKLLFFDEENILDSYYTSNIKLKYRKNRNNSINKYKYIDNDIYNSYKFKKEKCYLKSKNIILFNLLKYLIFLILLNPLISKFNIILKVKKTYNFEQILYTINIGKPITIQKDYGSYEYDGDYLKFKCGRAQCEVTLSWEEQINVVTTQLSSNTTDEETQEPEQDSSLAYPPENPIVSPNSPVGSVGNPISGQNQSFGQGSALGNVRLLEDSKLVSGENLFKDCHKIISITFTSDFYFLSILHMFDSCYSLETIENLIVKDLDNFESAFFDCRSLKNVTFEDCSLLNQNINARTMFANCISLETINLNKCGEIKLSDIN